MKMKIKFTVEEVLYHQRELEVSDEFVKELQAAAEEDDDGLLSGLLGDYTSGATAQDGEYMNGEFSISN